MQPKRHHSIIYSYLTYNYCKNMWPFLCSVFPEILLRKLSLWIYKILFPFFPLPLLIPYIELVVTTRCSLKCKDCANLIQYYHHPQDFDTSEILLSIDKLLDSIDYIDMFRILGGEPLLHKDISTILIHCQKKKKINRVELVTNGTLIPKEDVITSLQHPKMSVYISNYGQYSSKSEILMEILKNNKISYYFSEEEKWYDMGVPERRPFTVNGVIDVFRTCNHSCRTLMGGIVYFCPRSAHGNFLRIIPEAITNYVDVLQSSPSEIRKKITSLYNIEYLEACYYCNPVEERVKIIPGIQKNQF